MHTHDRVLVLGSLAKGGVDEVATCGDSSPQRSVVAENDLSLCGFAENAHVGDAPVGDEVARSGGVAAVLRPLRITVLSLFNLAAYGGNHDVAFSAWLPRPPGRVTPRHSRRERLSCSRYRDHRAAPRGRMGPAGSPRTPTSHGSLPDVGRVHVTVEHEGLSAAGAFADTEYVARPLETRVPCRSCTGSSTCCHCTARPISRKVSAMNRAISPSLPVKLGIATASLAQATSRSESDADVRQRGCHTPWAGRTAPDWNSGSRAQKAASVVGCILRLGPVMRLPSKSHRRRERSCPSCVKRHWMRGRLRPQLAHLGRRSNQAASGR